MTTGPSVGCATRSTWLRSIWTGLAAGFQNLVVVIIFVVYVVPAYLIYIRSEERMMIGHFDAEYIRYRDRVPMLIPARLPTGRGPNALTDLVPCGIACVVMFDPERSPASTVGGFVDREAESYMGVEAFKVKFPGVWHEKAVEESSAARVSGSTRRADGRDTLTARGGRGPRPRRSRRHLVRGRRRSRFERALELGHRRG